MKTKNPIRTDLLPHTFPMFPACVAGAFYATDLASQFHCKSAFVLPVLVPSKLIMLQVVPYEAHNRLMSEVQAYTLRHEPTDELYGYVFSTNLSSRSSGNFVSVFRKNRTVAEATDNLTLLMKNEHYHLWNSANVAGMIVSATFSEKLHNAVSNSI